MSAKREQQKLVFGCEHEIGHGHYAHALRYLRPHIYAHNLFADKSVVRPQIKNVEVKSKLLACTLPPASAT
jgi:hypothetical protein